MTTLGRVSSSDGGAPDRPQVWRTLALVYLATNARYGSGLLKRRTQRVMSREEREVIHGILERVPPTVASWSHGNAAMHPFDVVEVRRPLRSLSSSGGGNWWAGPRDCRDDVRELAGGKQYDSIYVLWPSGGDVQHCGWGCTAGRREGIDGAGFSSIPSDHWPSLTTDTDPEQGYVHEWLHQVESEYREYGVGPDRLPSLHDADLSSCRPASEPPFGQPYNVYHDAGARTWRPWYEDLMTGRVRRPDGRGCFGLTEELWALRSADRDRESG
jgi:hypothetical protein